MLKRIVIPALFLALIGCSAVPRGVLQTMVPMSAQSLHTMQGRVAFPGRAVQATMANVAAAATVSLIDTSTDTTVCTTVTDSSGNFLLALPGGFVPDPTKTYFLEAVKGLSNNFPGNNAARVRTVVKFNSGWSSLTGSTIVVDDGTTGIAVGGALKGVTDFSPYLGTVTPGSPDTYAPTGALSASDFTTLMGIVDQILADNADPVAGIGTASGNWVLVNQGLSFNTISATADPVLTPLTVTGTGFSPNASNSVNFGGVPSAAVASSNGTSLSIVVPHGALTGQSSITVGTLTALGPMFTVMPSISGVSPDTFVPSLTSGLDGTQVTLYGDGFGNSGTATIGGLSCPVVSWSDEEVTVFIPYGASSNPIVLSTGGYTATSPTVSAVSNEQPDWSFESAAVGSDPVADAADAGGSSRTVVSSSTARSGSNVLRFTAMGGQHEVYSAGITPTHAVVVDGFWVQLNSSIDDWWYPNVIWGRGRCAVMASIWNEYYYTHPYGSGAIGIPGAESNPLWPFASWTYVQATASVVAGQAPYGVNFWGLEYSGSTGLMFDVDDVVLFEANH